jgi:hypothetical protein
VSDLHDVTLGSSAIFQIKRSMLTVERNQSQESDGCRPVAFRLHLSMGLALELMINYFVGLHQAIFPEEA